MLLGLRGVEGGDGGRWSAGGQLPFAIGSDKIADRGETDGRLRIRACDGRRWLVGGRAARGCAASAVRLIFARSAAVSGKTRETRKPRRR